MLEFKELPDFQESDSPCSGKSHPNKVNIGESHPNMVSCYITETEPNDNINENRTKNENENCSPDSVGSLSSSFSSFGSGSASELTPAAELKHHIEFVNTLEKTIDLRKKSDRDTIKKLHKHFWDEVQQGRENFTAFENLISLARDSLEGDNPIARLKANTAIHRPEKHHSKKLTDKERIL